MSRQQKRYAERKTVKSPKKTSEATPQLIVGATPEYDAKDLSERQLEGFRLFEALNRGKARITVIDPETTIYWSSNKNDTAYTVTVRARNDRGVMVNEYRCSCPDARAHARRDCLHRFCEKLRRGQVIVQGPIPKSDGKRIAGRRPARKRRAADGRSIKSAQRDARVEMPTEVPRLILSLKDRYDALHPPALSLRHGGLTADSLRAAVLLLKVSEGKSADAMVKRYQELIGDGKIRLRKPPHQNTLTNWMNDETLTPVLEEMLNLSAEPFRVREVAAIIDSSKVSQLRTAHARLVDYGTDERPTANWMKAHALVGVETMVVLAVVFSDSNKHDSPFLTALLEKVPAAFGLRFLLGDKAYLSEDHLGWLWERGIKATIPVKSRWDPETKTKYYEACKYLAEWYDKREREFDEVYRLRPKIEGLFSLLKRLADGFCWSRGRPSSSKAGPSTAWKNETLCKFIYMNLRATVLLQEETGYTIDYLVHSRFFPPPDEPLLKADP